MSFYKNTLADDSLGCHWDYWKFLEIEPKMLYWNSNSKLWLKKKPFTLLCHICLWIAAIAMSEI